MNKQNTEHNLRGNRNEGGTVYGRGTSDLIDWWPVGRRTPIWPFDPLKIRNSFIIVILFKKQVKFMGVYMVYLKIILF